MNINVTRFAAVVAASLSLCAGEAWGTDTNRNLPPKCKDPDKKCDCPGQKVENGCIKVTIDLGETTPWTGSIPCELKIFADNDSPLIFTADSLYAILGGYTFKRLGTQNLSDGATPAEVVLSRKNGEAVHFVFRDGESMARPDPGIHIKMDERLQMVDAEGWATASDPVYYDLYVGDGTRRRFLASDMTGALGSLVSITDARGVTATPEEMRIDIVYDSNGVRQFLTPSRLADITLAADFSGYDVTVYALQEAPAKDAQTCLYTLPAGLPVEVISIRRENDGKRAVVTQRKGGGETKRYVFDYAMGDWSLRRPSGMEERKERYIADEKDAKVIEEAFSAAGVRLSRTEYNYKWESWGFALTNKVEGFDGLANITTWTYYTSGNGKGQVKTEMRQSGLLTQYTYDSVDRVISETRSGPGMMTEVTAYDYTPVDPSDPVLPVDTRPRTVVRKLNNIECERTYYVYSPLTNIVERVGAQGAAYGGTNALRTATAYYPVVANDARSGFVASIRREDGRLDLYDYALSSNIWTRTVTHLHEQSPSPVSGKTTRDITLTNARGETAETRTEAYIDGIWYTIARNRMTYNAEGKRTSVENLAGQVTTTAWDCCHKVSEVQPDGSTTTWDYDAEGRMIASSRLIPLDMTNVTWLTTCYRYDDLGRQTATWQTNFAAQVGLPAERTAYDQLGRVIARVDTLGNTTTTEYSPDGRTVSVRNPNTSTRVTARSASGDVLSITGTAVTPEFHIYGISPDGTRWSRTVQGETASSPRFTKRYKNMLGQLISTDRSGFSGVVLAIANEYDEYGRVIAIKPDGEPVIEHNYNILGENIAKVFRVPSGEWRKEETANFFMLLNTNICGATCKTTSCSDSAVAPISTTVIRQFVGLTVDNPAMTYVYDPRGNTYELKQEYSGECIEMKYKTPGKTNEIVECSRYGVVVFSKSATSVLNYRVYDSLGRLSGNIDGRGNYYVVGYDSLGRCITNVDESGNVKQYRYDNFGRVISEVNSLGVEKNFEYDLRGNKIRERGGVYPTVYTFDVFGAKTSMRTFRNELRGFESGDVTHWLYDESSGLLTNKIYSSGNGPSFDYDANGRIIKRRWARGVDTYYEYDEWGNCIRTSYSDGTPPILIKYDALGKRVWTSDEAGETAYIYDDYGSILREQVMGNTATNVLDRFTDRFGRDAGYAINGIRVTTIHRDPASGRISSMSVAGCSDDFVWTYHPGTDLKHTLRYPDGSLVTWEYEPNRANVTVVSNDVYSLFRYMYDSAGRRIVANDDRYAYNCRDELTSVSNINSGVMFSYVYDDIGNRIRSQEPSVSCEYFVNELNQYTNVIRNGVFDVPKFDLDGNQTNIVTSTGEWAVEYNAENRPIKWVRKTMSDGSVITNQTVVTMSYDCLGRRVWKNDKNFLYDNYLNITQTIWDPTEPVATVPVVWKERRAGSDEIIFLFHDVNKNVVTTKGTGLKAYSYNPYGPMNVVTNDQMPWQYSSEYCDNSWEDDVGLVYYNFREYSPADGRWMTFDKNGDSMDKNLLLFVGNSPLLGFDILGNDGCYKYGDPYIVETETEVGGWTPWRNRTTLTKYWVDERAYPFILTPWGFPGGLLLKIQRCACVYNRFEEKERVITKKVHKKQKYRCVFGCPEVSMTYDEDLGWSEEISSEKHVRGISSTDPIYLSPLRGSDRVPDCYLTCILNIMN